MRVLVTGSSGFIGSALVPYLAGPGHEVTTLVRRGPAPGTRERRWDPESGTIDTDGLSGIDACVHLAAESISARRWSPEQKARIRDSRVMGTRLLCETLAGLEPMPGTLVCASSDVFYGERGDETMVEDSEPGSTFLAGITHQWEASTAVAAQAGIRVVNLRFGMVIGPRIVNALTRFRLGLGSRLGSGKQYVSWITLDDAVRAVQHALVTEDLDGPVNTVTPHPVTNAELIRTLKRVLSRSKPVFPLPALILRATRGEMADIDLCSVRMDPAKLLISGFEFQYPGLESALRQVLDRPQRSVPQ